MKKTIAVLFAIASAAAFAGMNDLIVSFSTPGPDKYADGTEVKVGECYSLVYTKADGSQEIVLNYQTKLAGLSKALLQVGYTLSCEYDASIQRVKVKARHCIDYSDYADISSDLGIGLSITVGRVDDYNHCIALGTGELTERMVRELWLYNGTIYTEKPAALLEGDIRSMTFDYPNAESEDELLSSARDALLEHAPLTTAEIDLSQIQLDLQLDDTILTVDRDLNISATKSVSQRVLTISTRGETIRTEVE